MSAHSRSRLVTRHLANYLAAVELARRHQVDGAVVDVGSGVGALGVWAAQELDAPVCLVEPDPTARAIAARAFPEASVAAAAEEVAPGSARLVTAMEVIEHIPPREQPEFLRQLSKLVAPGGIIVLSTPDESGYLGGWSGYQPHVGTLSEAELQALLARNCHWPVAVWRLGGEPFELGRVRAVTEPVLNRVWGWVERRAPNASERASRASAAVARRGAQAAALLGRRPGTEGDAGTDGTDSTDGTEADANTEAAAGTEVQADSANGRRTGRTDVPEVWASVDGGTKATGLLGVVQRPGPADG